MKIYYPEDRILEDNDNKTQTRFGFDFTEDESIKLIQACVKKVKVKHKYDQEVSVENAWLSKYEITLGKREPFIAHIITNYANTETTGSYRLLVETEGIVDFSH